MQTTETAVSDYERERGKPLPSKAHSFFLLDAGVKSCWLVQPALRTITTFDHDMRSKTYSEGVVTDPATGIEMAIKDVFRDAES